MKQALFTLVVLASAATASAQFAFHSGGLGSAGTPRGIVTADFDRDGHLDFAEANYGTPGHDINVWYWHPRKGFFRFQFIDLGAPNAGAFSIAAGDLNHDGHPDLAAALADIDVIAVFLWSPSGFVRQPDISLSAPANPREVKIADVNRDGHGDIVVTLYERGTLTTLLGMGSGASWSAGIDTIVGRGAHGLALAEFRGFGVLDAVLTNALTNKLTLAFNTGSGTFSPESYPVGGSPRNVTVGDFNHDRRPDVAVVNTASNSVTVYFSNPQWPNNDDAAFFTGRVDLTGVGKSPRDLEAIDANGDGFADLAVASYDTDQVIVIHGWEIGAGLTPGRTTLSSASGPRTLAVGDFDEDGRPDILVGNQKNGVVFVFFNDTPFAERP